MEIFHADRITINMKHIKHDFRLKASVSSLGWTKGMGSKGQNSTFSEHSHVAYQIKEKHECSNKVANILPTDPPLPPPPHTHLTLGMESLGQNSTFSEHGHVTYQIKGNHSMQQHGNKYFAHRPLPTLSPHPLTLWLGSKGQNSTFSEHGLTT